MSREDPLSKVKRVVKWRRQVDVVGELDGVRWYMLEGDKETLSQLYARLGQVPGQHQGRGELQAKSLSLATSSQQQQQQQQQQQ